MLSVSVGVVNFWNIETSNNSTYATIHTTLNPNIGHVCVIVSMNTSNIIIQNLCQILSRSNDHIIRQHQKMCLPQIKTSMKPHHKLQNFAFEKGKIMRDVLYWWQKYMNKKTRYTTQTLTANQVIAILMLARLV